jgi:hypothetical protein
MDNTQTRMLLEQNFMQRLRNLLKHRADYVRLAGVDCLTVMAQKGFAQALYEGKSVHSDSAPFRTEECYSFAIFNNAYSCIIHNPLQTCRQDRANIAGTVGHRQLCAMENCSSAAPDLQRHATVTSSFVAALLVNSLLPKGKCRTWSTRAM